MSHAPLVDDRESTDRQQNRTTKINHAWVETMKKKTAAIAIAAIIASYVTVHQASASEANSSIHFSGKLQASRIEAAEDSTLRLGSMKLRGSNLGSLLNVKSNVRIGKPVTTRKGAQLRMASLDLNNARIGGPANLEMNVHVQKGINGDEGSDIGIGGVQITADNNYNPQDFESPAPSNTNQSINNGGIPAGIPGATIGQGHFSGPTGSLNNSRGKTNGNAGEIQEKTTSGQQLLPLSQRDPQWSNTKLGNTNLTLGDYGCLVTSLAMLKGTTPDKVNGALVKKNGFTSEGYLIHNVADKTLGIGNGAKKGKNWKPGYDTVAEVSFNGAQHFVVWRTDGTILDPWTGKAESQSKYPLVSFRDYHKG